MATLKHINSKNADYGAAEQYLLFEHDEFTMKPVLDETGRLIPREDYRLSTLNCGGEDFAVACMRANLRYEKNQRREDVKSHHYIISFDPRDGPDNGLTVDRAQELGEKFCAEHFPGHQALVCTHPDGHNHSGNIHVHIVINSLRIYEVPLLPYMDRPADTREGCKHRCTNAAMEYFKSEVMEMCHREGLLSDIRPPEIEIELEKEIEIEKEREGETGHPAPAAYGRYNNVILTDTELSGLKTELPDKWEYYIDRLSCHIASTGKQYHSHAATIYKWAQEDAAKGKAAPKQGIPDYSCKEGESL